MSFDLLDRQPTDPPDVNSLETSLSQLQDLINNHKLLVSPYFVVAFWRLHTFKWISLFELIVTLHQYSLYCILFFRY